MRTNTLLEELQFLQTETAYLNMLAQNKLNNRSKSRLNKLLSIRSKAIIQLNDTRNALISEHIKEQLLNDLFGLIDTVNEDLRKTLNIQ